jgi:AhpD family alkylhydroperoxidase
MSIAGQAPASARETTKSAQLIAAVAALTAQCPYCIESDEMAARQTGASDAMLTKAGIVAAAMRAGAAVTCTSHLFEG